MGTELRRLAVREDLDQSSVSVLLDRLDLAELPRSLMYEAGLLPGKRLRSLDALHLATALRVELSRRCPTMPARWPPPRQSGCEYSHQAEEAGFEPAADIPASDRFQGGSDRPLRHPSKAHQRVRRIEILPFASTPVIRRPRARHLLERRHPPQS